MDDPAQHKDIPPIMHKVKMRTKINQAKNEYQYILYLNFDNVSEINEFLEGLHDIATEMEEEANFDEIIPVATTFKLENNILIRESKNGVENFSNGIDARGLPLMGMDMSKSLYKTNYHFPKKV